MKRVWKVAPLTLALASLALVVWYGPTLVERTAYAVASGQSRAARDSLAELSKHDTMSPLFRAVDKAVRPAVVVINVKQKIEVSSQDPQEMFRRFFGNNAPFRASPDPTCPACPTTRPNASTTPAGSAAA